jgi:glycosyltransferase involved in cell wall biosynthesis
MVAGGYLDVLHRLAAEHGVADRLRILEPAVPQAMERLAAAYDLGLVAETGYSRSRQLCLTNKMFSFLLAGLPILLSDTPAHRAFQQEAGTCAAICPVDDAAALASAIDGFLAHPDRLAAARRHAWRLGQERFNWDRESRALCDLVNATLAGRLTNGGLPTH